MSPCSARRYDTLNEYGCRFHLSFHSLNTHYYADGETETIKLPVEMWNQGPRFTYRVAGSRAVHAVEVDPRQALPDDDRSNNVWRR